MNHFIGGFTDELEKLGGVGSVLGKATAGKGVLAGGLAGGLAGAFSDEDHRIRNALVGALAGGTAGGMGGSALGKRFRVKPTMAQSTGESIRSAGKGTWNYLNKPVGEVAGDIASLPIIGLLGDAMFGMAGLGTVLGLAAPAGLAYGAYKGLESIGNDLGVNSAMLAQEAGWSD